MALNVGQFYVGVHFKIKDVVDPPVELTTSR